MPGDTVHLVPFEGRSRTVPCGCEVVEMAERMIHDGKFLVGRVTLVTPCHRHYELAREVARTVGTSDFETVVEVLAERTA